jgi:hypothetical protein
MASNLWVAVGQGGNTIARSTDGIMWTGLGTTTFVSIGKGVAYGKDLSGNDVWVAVGAGGNTVAYSTNNGNTWTGLTNTVFSGSGNRVLYDPTASLWFAVGTGSNSVATTSYPTISWRGQGNLFPTTLASYSTNCVYGPAINYSGTQNITGYLVGGYSTGSLFALSANGTTWQMASSASLGASGMNTVAYGNGIFVAGGVPTAGGNTFATSVDGNTWTGRGGSTLSGHISQIAYGNGLFMAVGYKAASGSTVMRSTDGITWTNLTDLYNFGARCVFYCDGRWFVGGFSDAIKYSDSNGSFWSSSTPASLFGHTRSFGYGNGIVASVGQGTTNSLATSADFGVIWTGRGLLLAGYGNDIKYNGGVWLAVGGDNTTTGNIIVKSTDNGTTWTQIVTYNTSYFTSINGVQNANGLWYISGRGAYYLAYSITNNPTSISDFTMVSTSSVSFSTNAAFLTTFNYQKPKYIVGGQGMRGSVDGLSWFEIINQPFQRVMDVYWNGTIWVGVGAGIGDAKNTIAYSYDGINWVGIGTTIFTTIGNSVYYSTANSLWIATGEGYSNTIATSPNGVTWTGRGVTTFNTLGSKVIYDSNLLVAAGQGASPLVTSTDGINWNGTNTVLSSVKKVAFDGNLFVLVGGGIATSTNGTIWRDNTTPSGISATGVGYGNGKWVVVGRNNQNSQGGISYSTNGTSWTTATSNGGINEIYGVAYGNGLWVAVGQPYSENAGNNAIATSTDGITWTGRGQTVFPYSPNSIYGGTSVAYGNGLWVATGYGNSIATSTDGITWTGRGNSILPTATSVAYANGIWVAVGNGQWVSGSSGGGSFKIATSTNGITWTGRGTSALPNAMSVAYGNGLWVVVGSVDNNLDTIATSPDGITWTGRGKPIITHSINGVTYGNGRWVAVGSGTRIIINSTDGINWTPTNISVFTRGYDIAGPSLPSSTYSTAVLSGFSVPTKTFGDAAFELVAPTSNSDGAFTYTSSNIAVATVTNNMVTIVGGGTATITATQASTAIYASNTITATLTVSKITTVLSNFSAITKTMGDASFAIVTPTTNSDGAFFTYTSSNTAVATVTNNIITIVGAGSSTITVVQFATQNYTSGIVTATLTVNQGTTILNNFSAITKTFGNAAFNLVAPTTNGNGAFTYTSSNLAVATITGSTVTIVGGGTATITANQANTTNYSAATITASLTVNQATPTITNFSVPAKVTENAPFTIVNPTSNSSGAFTYTSSDTSVATIDGSIMTIVGKGTSTITATQASTTNYVSGSITATFIVRLTPVVTDFSAITKTFGDASFSIVAPTTDSDGTFTYTSSNTAVATVAGSTITIVSAGTSTITATQSLTANYVSATITATLTVNKAITVLSNFAAITKTFGNAAFNLVAPTTNGNGAFTYTSSNTAVATIAGSTVTIVGGGTATITASQATTTNYLPETITASITVSQATPTITKFDVPAKAIGTAPFSIAPPTSNSNGAFTYTSSDTSVATIDGSMVTIVGLGNTTITAVQSSTANFISATTTGILSIMVNVPLSIAVGQGGNSIATSTDLGLTWTGRGTTSFTTAGYGVAGPAAYNVSTTNLTNSLYIATGVNTFLKSTDGVTWTSIAGTNLTTGYVSYWSGTMWIIGGINNINYGTNYSTYIDNVLTWTYRKTTVIDYMFGLYNNGSLWVATGQSGNGIATSSDGITWVGRGYNFSSGESDVVWGNNTWVAVGSGDNGNSIVTSTDGITWTGRGKTIFSIAAQKVAWNGSLFVAVGSGGNTIAYSNNGSSWTGNNTIFTSGLSVAWNQNMWIALGSGGNTIAYSTDGITWSGSNDISGNKIYWSSNLNKWIISVTNSSTYYTSSDGISWSSNTLTSGTIINMFWSNPIIYTKPTFVAVGQGGNTLVSSTNGTTWSASLTTPFTTAGYGVAWNGTQWVAVGFGTNTIAYSADGLTWIGNSTFSIKGNDVAYGKDSSGNGLWVVAGQGGNSLATSTNGITWTGRTSTTVFTSSGLCVAFGKDGSGNILLVAVGEGGNTIATSTNGQTWTGRGATVFTSQGLGVTYANNLWIAVGSGGNSIATSTNGTTWTGLGTSVFTTRGNGIRYTNNLWVATGEGGNTIATSVNGTTWFGRGSTVFTTAGRDVLGLRTAEPTIIFTIPLKNIGDAPFTMAPTSNSTGLITYTSSNLAVATIDGSTVTIVGMGTSTITAVQASTDYFISGTTTATLTVENVKPVVTDFAAITKTFGDAAFSIVAPTTNSDGIFTYTSSNTAVATVAGSTITIVGGGTSTITAYQAITTDYGSATITAPLTVSQATTVLSGFSEITKTFGNAAFSLVAPTTNSTGAFTYTSSNTAVATIAGSTITIVGAGIATITASQASNVNFTSATTTTTLTVNQATTVLTGFSVATKTFGNAAFSIVAPTTNSNGAFTYTSSDTAVATIAGTTVTIVGAGTATITASQASTTNFTAGTTTATLTVNKATPTISSFSAITKTFGDAAFNLVAPTTNSTGAITYTSSNTAVATVDGITVTIVGGGTATITASQATTANYLAGTITASLTVNKITTILSGFSVAAKTFGDASFNLVSPTTNSTGTFTYTSSNTAVATIVGTTITIVGAGTSTITANQATNTNYTASSTTASLVVSKATPTYTSFSIPQKIIGNSAFAITPPVSNSTGAFTYTSSNTAVATIAGSTITIVGIGTSTITANQATTTNYLASTTTALFSVINVIPTITGFSVPAVKTFGDAPFSIETPSSNSTGAFTYTSSNTAVATIAGNVVTIVGGGTSTISAIQASTTSFTTATVTATLTVNGKTTVLSGFSVAAKTFGDASFNLVNPTTNSNGAFTYTSSNTAVATIVGSTVTIVGGGTSTISAVQASTNNYLTATITSSLIVSQGTPTITNFAAVTKEFGDVSFNIVNPTSNSTSAFTYTSSNPAVATVAGNVVTIVAIGTTTITASQASTSNYISGTIAATLQIIRGLPTLSNFSIPNRTIGNTSFIITPPTSNGDGVFTYTSSNELVAKIVGNRIAIVGIGTSTITATQAATTNFLSSTTTANFQVNAITTVLTISPIPAKTFNDIPFKLQASSNNGSAITYTSSDTSVLTIAGDMATIVSAGTTTITASQESNATYTSGTTTYELEINLITTVLTNFSAITKTFGNMPFSIRAPSTNSDGLFTYTSSNTAVATITNNVITIIGAGTSTITASQATTTNFSAETISATLTVSAATPLLTNFSTITKTFGDAAFNITPPSSNSSGLITYSSSNRLVATIADNSINIVGAGSCTITASQASTANYTTGTITASLVVNKAITSMINFTISERTFGIAPFTLVPPTSNSNGIITYTSSNTNVATIVGNTVTIVGIGSSTITAVQPITANFLAGTISTTLVAIRGTPVITNFSGITKTFGDADFALVPPTTNSNGLITYTSSNLAVATVTDNIVTIVGVGTSTITAIQSSSTNFLSGTITATITVTPVTTVLTNFSAITKTFGNDAFTITPPTTNSTGDFTYTSSNTAVATIANNMVTIVGGGNTTITVVQASTANYTSATTTAVLTVNPIKTVLSNFPAITKIPGDAPFNLVPPTSNSNGLITYTSSNPAVATIDGDSVTIVGRGTSTITAVQQSTSNYSSETIRTTLQVSSIITVLSNFVVSAKTVGDTNFSLVPPTTNGTGAFTYTSSNLLIATVAGDIITVVGTGSCTITATQASTENSTSATITASFVVGRATTTITNFSVPAKAFGNAPFTITPPTTNSNGAFTYTSSNTDVATISRNIITIVGVGSSTITATQPNTANYTSGTISTTFEVSQGTPVLTNFVIPTKTIGDAAFAIVPPVSNSTGLITYTSSDSSVATIDGNTITIVGRGSSTITAEQESTTNFVSGTITALFTINKIPTVLTNFTVGAKTFGDASFALTDPSSNSDGLITYTSSNPAVATIDGNTITIVGGGNTTITAVQASTSNYTQGSISALFQVYQIETVLSEFDIPAKIIGEEAFTIDPPITNGDGAFVYTSSNPAVATIEGNTLTIVGLGNSTIKAVQASTANYTTDAITTTFQVKLIRTVLSNFVVPAKTVGDTNFSLVPPTTNSTGLFTYTSSNLLVATVAGDVVTIVGTGNVTITAFQESTENSTSARITASLSVNKATNSISWFSVPEKAFGNEPFTLVPPTTNSNGAFTYTSSNTDVATIVRNVVTIVGVGTSTITAVQANTVNYTAGTITATFEVTQGTPTITNFVVPAKTIGNEAFAIVAPTSNSNGTFTYTSSDLEVATIEGNTITIVGVGSSTITATQASTTNFVSATTTSTLQVNRIQTVLTNFEIPIKTFRDASFSIVPPTTNSDGAFTYTSSDIEVATIINGSMINIVGAGNATITAVQASTDDYTSATITELFQVNQMRTVLSNFAIPAKIIGEGEFAIVPPTTNSNNVFTYTSSNTEVATIEDETINIVGLGTSIITANQASTDDYTSARITALFEVNLLTTVLSDFVVPAKIIGDTPFAITPPTTNTIGAFTYTSSNRLVATIVDNIITIVGVGSCIITARQASTANSTSATITAPFVITKDTPNITNFSVPEKLFGNAPFKLTPPTSNSVGAFTYTSSDTSVATINRDMVTIIGIGSSTITAVQASTANFISGSITAVFQVDSGTPVLSGFVVPTKTALDASFALVTPTTNSDGAFTYTSSNPDVATIEGDVVTIVGAGTSTITADQASTEKYLSGTITATFTVNPITTVLTNFPALSSALGNAAFIITPPTTNSDGAFTYTSSRLSVATIEGDVVTIVGGGISTITAVQASTTNYTSATITTSIQVSALTTVLSNFSVPTKAVGDAPFAITTPTTNGDGTFTYTSSNTAVVTIVGNMATIVGAGTATIRAVQSSTPNYSSASITALLTVNRGVPIITNFSIPIKEIRMPDFLIIDPSSTSIGAFTYTSSNIKVATIFRNTVSIKGIVGNTIITASQAMSTNYIAGTTSTTFFVNQLSPTLSTPFVVPETKTVGDATFKLIAPKSNSISPFVFTSSNQAVVKIAKDVVSIIGSGTATITATQAATKSFGPKTVTGSIQVNPRVVFLSSFFIPKKIVGTAPFTLLNPITNSNGAFTYTSSNTEVATIAGNVVTVLGVGTSTITASQASTANFTAGTISTTLHVNLPTPQVGSLLITNKSMTNPSFTIVDPTKPADNTSAWEYTSSDTTIATIDDENEITLLQPGIVTITALLSSDSLYNSVLLMTQFSISPANIIPSSFEFVRSSEVAAIIPVTIIPSLNTVLPTTISTPANVAKFNPKLGTVIEKQANHNIIVNSLFNIFPTAVSISIPSTLLYMPATISIAKLKTIRIVRPNGSTVENPLVINTIAADSAVVFLCSMIEHANSIRLNGVGTNLGNFIVISKGVDNKYLVTRTTKTNVSVSAIETNGHMVSFGGITALIGYI